MYVPRSAGPSRSSTSLNQPGASSGPSSSNPTASTHYYRPARPPAPPHHHNQHALPPPPHPHSHHPHPHANPSSSPSQNTRQHTYHPLPPLSLRAPHPPYRYPHLIGTYSHLADRSIVPGDASMSYYRPCPVGADLNYGFERRIERSAYEDEHLDGLCGALQRAWEGVEGGVERDGEVDGWDKGDDTGAGDGAGAGGNGGGERKGGIITWRGMITRIMTAPYDRDPWEMTAIALDGSVYIELHDPPDVRLERERKQSAWAAQSYMGVAYESFSTVPAPAPVIEENGGKEREREGGGGGENDWPEGWSGDVNTNVQWCNVIRSAIGDIPLCLGGEVDCVQGEPGCPHPGLDRCMELKTNGVITNEKQERVFHKKLLKHWAQSYLLGIPTIEVGFRSPEGVVQSRRTFETLAIPRLVAAATDSQWHPSPAFAFLHSTLTMVLQHVLPTDPSLRGKVSEDESLPPAVVWRFSYVPRRGCELWCEGEMPHREGERWGGVLRPEYVRWRLGRG